jgi:antitoxin component HigA of HigAB toxin-antitoxin module
LESWIMPSAAEIQAYLSANPGMSDADIAAAMNQYGVSTADMAAATGSNLEDIQSRYDAVTPAVEEPAADPYEQAYEPAAPVATSPFVSAFTPSNFVEPVDEPVAPVAAPEARGIASLPPQAPVAPIAEPQGILSGISGAVAPVIQPEGILSGVVTPNAPDIITDNMPPVAPVKPTDQEIVKFLTDNPGTTDVQIAKIMQDTGLKPEDIARATGSKVEDVTNRYEAATAPQDGIAALSGGKTSPVVTQPPVAALPPVEPVVPSAPEVKYGNDKYTKTQVTDYIGTVMNDTKLAPWEKTNKIMESAQKAGMTTDDLKAIYGKDVVDPYLKDYGAGIKSYITDTLADPKKSDFEKLAAINQAADKYGLDPKEISSYAGMNEKGVQKVFESFETGLKSIVTNLSAPTVSDIDKTKGALQLQSKYGITDDQIAKALGGDMTGKDVKAYLDPVKNFAPKFQEITTDNTKTASDIRSFIDDAKKDPRISGLYGLAIQNAEKMLPVLGLRDSMAGKGTPEELTKGYTDFVAAVNADPSLKEKYGAQADAIDKVAKMSQRIADEQYGGKLQPHMFQTFIGLDQKTLGDIPKTLEMTPGETQTVTDNEGNTQTYTTPGTLKDTKGYEPVYTTTGSGDTETKE